MEWCLNVKEYEKCRLGAVAIALRYNFKHFEETSDNRWKLETH
jgi:hypothetical protein